MLAVAVYYVAPFVGGFFDEPASVPLLRMLGLSLLFQGFTNIAVVLFQRDLTFDKEFSFRVSGAVVDAIVAIGAALALRSAWALVFGAIAGSLTQAAASFLLHPYRPRPSLAREPLRDLFGYGMWMTFAETLTVVAAHGAGLLVGKTLGITALGIYEMAKRIPYVAIGEPGVMLSQVAFPVYAQAQHDVPRLTDAYRRLAGLAAAIAMPAAFGLLVVGEEFVSIALGDRWSPIVRPLQIFVVSGLCMSIARTVRPVLMARGLLDVMVKLELVRVSVLAVLIYPLAVGFGVSGAAVAMLIGSATLLLLSSVQLQQQLGLSAEALGRMFVPAIVASLLMCGAVLVFKRVTAGWPGGSDAMELAWLAATITTGGVVYCAVRAILASAGTSSGRRGRR